MKTNMTHTRAEIFLRKRFAVKKTTKKNQDETFLMKILAVKKKKHDTTGPDVSY